MSGVSRYSDRHTLYVSTGAAGNEDVVRSITKALKQLERTSKKKYPCNIVANVIYDRDNIPYGFGYVHITNTQVYNMLLGKNPDGSDRTKIVEKESKSVFTPEDGVVWIKDWSQDERELEIEELPGLLAVPFHRYTREQASQFQKFYQKAKLREEKHRPKSPLSYDGFSFIFEKAHVKPVGEQYSLNILCGRKIPPWLNQKTVYNQFRRFVSDKRMKKKTKIKNRVAEVPYPEVTINRKKGLCFIEFNPLSRDAQFALLMMTKTVYVNPRNPSQKSVIYFSHAFKSKRM